MRYLLLIIWIIIAADLYGQKKPPILERRISVSFTNEKLPDVLSRIAQEAKFSFSYNPSLVKDNRLVTFKAADRPVREVLNNLFKGTITYKEKSDHLILVQALPRNDASTKVVVISGYVEDARTREKIARASVYDKATITSAVTDDFGYFTMKLDKEQAGTIAVSKKDYQDTVVAIVAPDNQYITVSIAPANKDSLHVSAVATSDSLPRRHMHMPFDERPNIQNIKDTLHREMQVSFVPFVGTNGLLSGNVINDYSFNIVGGYSMGTRKIEIGGLFNLDRGDVSFLQIAGFANGVGRNVNGFQAAGFFNVNGGEANAVQLAGHFNLNFKDFTGVQVAGFTNINLSSSHGAMISGFTNIASGQSGGLQLAGFTNMVFGNYKGSQISGFFNYARKLNGSQISVFNYADSLTGVPIGVFSYVRHGYHKLEISSDEIFYTNVYLKSGIKKFYNILMAGMKPKPGSDNQTVWTFGYGLGTAPKLTRWLDLNIDISSQKVNKGSFTKEVSMLNKLYVGFDCKLAQKLSLVFGATLNGYITNNTYTDYPNLFTDYSPHFIANHNHGEHTNLKMWWGARVGLRFF